MRFDQKQKARNILCQIPIRELSYFASKKKDDSDLAFMHLTGFLLSLL